MKAAAALANSNKASTVVEVLADPGCLASVPEEDSSRRGWTIGPTACVTTTRSEDTCSGGRLAKYICCRQNGQLVKSYRDVACPNGCVDGACLRPGQPDPLLDVSRPFTVRCRSIFRIMLYHEHSQEDAACQTL